jgi:hypothetical protein
MIGKSEQLATVASLPSEAVVTVCSKHVWQQAGCIWCLHHNCVPSGDVFCRYSISPLLWAGDHSHYVRCCRHVRVLPMTNCGYSRSCWETWHEVGSLPFDIQFWVQSLRYQLYISSIVRLCICVVIIYGVYFFTS